MRGMPRGGARGGFRWFGSYCSKTSQSYNMGTI